MEENYIKSNRFTKRSFINNIIIVIFLVPLSYALCVTIKPSLPGPPPDTNTAQSVAIDTAQVNWGNFINLGLNQYNNGNYPEAIKAWQQALQYKIQAELAYSNIGSAYGKMGDWESQKKYCEMALAVNPNFELAKSNLQQATAELKKKGK